MTIEQRWWKIKLGNYKHFFTLNEKQSNRNNLKEYLKDTKEINRCLKVIYLDLGSDDCEGFITRAPRGVEQDENRMRNMN